MSAGMEMVPVSLGVRNHYNGHIYFARRLDGLVKIGRTHDMRTRTRALQSTYPGMQLLHTIGTNATIVLEHEIHMRFSEYHVRTEWFALPDTEIAQLLSVYFVYLKPETIHLLFHAHSCICAPDRGSRSPRRRTQAKGGAA